jgi:cytochrome c
MRYRPIAALLCLLAASAHAAPDATRGQAVYQARCAACHSPDFNGIGPAHRGVFGRLAGTAKGFANYSAALKASGITWNESSLDRWLANPEALVPGQAMGISLPDAGERADVIAFLRTLAKAKE